MSKKLLFLITAVVVCLIAGTALASKVSDVELFYDNGITTAKIQVDGAVRFTHQTEVAKDNKPYRVIVDVLSATHNLGGHKFVALPNCPVKAIRSSQYAVNPEAIVRVVFDMDSERVYRIDTKENYIYVYFTDQNTKPFDNWSTTNYLKSHKTVTKPAATKTPVIKVAVADDAKSVKQLNTAINQDRLASLENNQPTEKSTVAKKETAPVKKAASVVAKTEQPASYPTFPTKAKEATASESKPAPIKVTPKVEVKKEEAKPVVIKTESKPVVKPAPVKAAKTTVAKAEKKATPVVAKTEEKAKPVEVASEETTKNTSRFRRSAEALKIQGTLVAEFPKRLVIKYDNLEENRDPFETLINESKQYNNPVSQRIPNVEGLRLVGIIETDDNNNRALFEDKDGYGFMLKTGDKVRKGYVLQVDDDEVFFQIFEYGWSRTISLSLES